MHKAKDVIGLPVLDLGTGQELGVVRDVLFDKEWAFSGLFVEVKSLFRRGRFIPSDSIHAIGNDCITVPHQESLVHLSDSPQTNGATTGSKTFVGKPLYTTEGQCLGQVEDIYFGEEIGHMVGYEVSDGLISDLLNGRRSITNAHCCTVGDDAIVINYSTEEEVT